MPHKIVAGLCTLGQPKDTFIDFFVKLTQSGLISRFCKMSGSLLPFVRNAVVQATYLRDPDFTHILFTDDDMCDFTDESLELLISEDKSIISAFMLKRSLPYQVVHAFENNTPEEIMEHYRKEEVVEVSRVGMAFTLIKREVFDAVIEHTECGPIWFQTDRGPRRGFEDEVDAFVQDKTEYIQDVTDSTIDHPSEEIRKVLHEAIILGTLSHISSSLKGEDTTFCNRAKMCGFSSWVHCGVPIGHIGNMSFDIRNTNQPLEVVKA